MKNALFYGLLPVLDGDPIVFHAVGVLCFLAGMSRGVYFLVRRVAACAGTALGVAAVWALAPTQVSTIIWLSAANIGICVGFMCLALIMYDKSREDDPAAAWPRVPWLLGAAAATFMGQISYETAVAIAPMALAMDWFRGRKLFARNTVLALGVLSLVTVSYLLLRGHYGSRVSASVGNMGFEPGLEKWKLTVSAPWFLWQHLLMWFAPVGRIELAGTYLWLRSASPAALAWSWAGWVVLLALLFLLRRKYPARRPRFGLVSDSRFSSRQFRAHFRRPYRRLLPHGIQHWPGLAAGFTRGVGHQNNPGTGRHIPIAAGGAVPHPHTAQAGAPAGIQRVGIPVGRSIGDLCQGARFAAPSVPGPRVDGPLELSQACSDLWKAARRSHAGTTASSTMASSATGRAGRMRPRGEWHCRRRILVKSGPCVEKWRAPGGRLRVLQLGTLLGKESKTRPIATDHLRVVLARPNSARPCFVLCSQLAGMSTTCKNDRATFSPPSGEGKRAPTPATPR